MHRHTGSWAGRGCSTTTGMISSCVTWANPADTMRSIRSRRRHRRQAPPPHPCPHAQRREPAFKLLLSRRGAAWHAPWGHPAMRHCLPRASPPGTAPVLPAAPGWARWRAAALRPQSQALSRGSGGMAGGGSARGRQHNGRSACRGRCPSRGELLMSISGFIWHWRHGTGGLLVSRVHSTQASRHRRACEQASSTGGCQSD